jgi:hypothetical protein
MVGRSIEALVEEKLAGGQEYEALQLYRGFASRKEARGDAAGAVQAAEDGAAMLLSRGWVDAATDLACQMAGIMLDSRASVDEGRPRVEHLDTLYRQIMNGEVELAGKGSAVGIAQAAQLRVKFLRAAQKWACEVGSRVTGDPQVSLLLGRALQASGDIDRALRHLVAADAAEELAQLVFSQEDSTAYEKDTRLARGALTFMALGNLRDANAVISAWRSGRAAGGRGGKGGKLLEFCTLLCKTCEYDAAPVFQKLVQMYEGAVIPHGDLMNLLKQIGKVYFGVQQSPSMMEHLMSMLGAA